MPECGFNTDGLNRLDAEPTFDNQFVHEILAMVLVVQSGTIRREQLGNFMIHVGSGFRTRDSGAVVLFPRPIEEYQPGLALIQVNAVEDRLEIRVIGLSE